MAGTYLDNVASLIQKIYKGALATCLLGTSPAYRWLSEKGKIVTDPNPYIRWPIVKGDTGNAKSIVDGATLPAASREEYDDAEMSYKIIIDMVKVGRLLQIGSTGEAYFKTPGAQNALTQQVNGALRRIARLMHLQIVALTKANANDMDSLGDGVAQDTNTYATINRATNSFWRPYVNDNGGVNRALTETLLWDMLDTMQDVRGAIPEIVWCGTTAFHALETLLRTVVTINNNDPNNLIAGALAIYWKGLAFIKMPNMDTNAMYWLDFETDGGISLYKQHEGDFIIKPEYTDSYDEKMSIAGHYNLVVNNPWKQGALLDVQ